MPKRARSESWNPLRDACIAVVVVVVAIDDDGANDWENGCDVVVTVVDDAANDEDFSFNPGL